MDTELAKLIFIGSQHTILLEDIKQYRKMIETMKIRHQAAMDSMLRIISYRGKMIGRIRQRSADEIEKLKKEAEKAKNLEATAWMRVQHLTKCLDVEHTKNVELNSQAWELSCEVETLRSEIEMLKKCQSVQS